MINRANELLERFMRYAAVTTQSEAGAKTVPSTAGQRVLAQMLAEELKALGLTDVEVSEYAVVTGRCPPTFRQAPKRLRWVGAHIWIRRRRTFPGHSSAGCEELSRGRHLP